MRLSDYIGSAILISVILSDNLQEFIVMAIRAVIEKYGAISLMYVFLLSQIDKIPRILNFLINVLFRIIKFIYIFCIKIKLILEDKRKTTEKLQ